MTSKLDTQQLTNNVVSGVAAGIVVSIVLGLYQMTMVYHERREQIRYINDLVGTAIERIQETDENSTRLLYYNILLRGIENYLNSADASSRIAYSEKEILRTALPYATNGSVTYLSSHDLLPEDAEAFFRDATGQFKGIPWLRLKR